VEKNSQTKIAGRWKLLAILFVCASPMIASYFAYYVAKPSGRTNYGDILDPRLYPMPQLESKSLNGSKLELTAFKGKWIMLQVDASACAQVCKKKLYDMRQLRIAQGKAMDRIERVWLVTDTAPIQPELIKAFDGMHILSIDVEILAKWLPSENNTKVSDHIYLIDPLGNLMMRFPKDADPNKIKKDLSKLLKASAIG
jgi:cytochrome oxidase Cu insertion factor (SCO1/SenC/PrrC family)